MNLEVKQAIRESGEKKGESYVLIRIQKSTVSFWKAIGDENGFFENTRNIRINGKKPCIDYSVECGDNVYIVRGKYIEVDHTDEAGKYDIFCADSWDVLYPVKRNSILGFLLPKSCLFKFKKATLWF